MQEKRRKRILMVVPTLECGGLERNVSLLCNHIDTTVYEITLAVLNNAHPYFPITNAGVTVIDLQIPNVRKSIFAIVKLSRKIQPDIILTTANHLNLLLGIFKWMFPKHIRIIARESSIVSINSRYAKLPVLYNGLLKLFYKKLDHIVCQSVYMQTDLVKHYRVPMQQTSVIYNAVQPPVLADSVDEPATSTAIITVARLSKEKGIDRLIRAVAQVKVPVRFTIIGEGAERQNLQRLINEFGLNDKVILAGGNAAPFTIVQHPHLFLMGSHYEGFPNAMLEALAAGIPVVAFDAPGGMAELLQHHENGILLMGNDETAFAAAVEKALVFAFNRDKIKEKILQQFDINTIMQRWYKIFETV